jgi:hypothetical protein
MIKHYNYDGNLAEYAIAASTNNQDDGATHASARNKRQQETP